MLIVGTTGRRDCQNADTSTLSAAGFSPNVNRSELPPAALLDALRSHAWFGSCDAALQQMLVTHARVCHLADGERLFERGDGADGLCCVIAGAVHAGAVQPDGRQALLAYLEPYQWFGEISMIDALPRTHDAVADGPASVLVVPRPMLLSWLDAHPAHWRDLARLACAKLRAAFSVLEDITHLSLEQRLAKRLWLASQGHDLQSGTQRRLIRLPQEQLAAMMGVSRQSVNKALHQLEARGALALRYGRIEIVDAAALREAGGVA